MNDLNINYNYITPDIYERAVSLRRDFHKYPESAFTEFRTTSVIIDELRKTGGEVYFGKDVCDCASRTNVPDGGTLDECLKRALSEGTDISLSEAMEGGFTGAVCVIKGKLPGPVRALRFDIDALKVNEATGLEFGSSHVGLMHACGHDGHAAGGLALAKILSENKEKLKGEVRIIFQPAEEGARGAKAVVESRWLDNVDEFYSGHIGISCRRLGEISCCEKGFLASSKINITFKGVSAHAAAAPEAGKNALLAACEFALKSSDIPSAVLKVNGLLPERKITRKVMVNVGTITAGNGRNIIADRAYIEAETRGETSLLNLQAQEKMKEAAENAARKYDTEVIFEVAGYAESASSSKELALSGKNIAEKMNLAEMYDEKGSFAASDDATVMMNYVQKNGGKAAYYMFGSHLKGEHHQNTFDFDEKVIAVMTEFFARCILEL